MGADLIRLGGGALRHIVGVLLLAWRRVVRAAGIALVAGIVVVEIVGSLVTHHFPPYLLTHVVALVFGVVVAYCVGLTVLVDELIKGTLDLVRMALGEVEAGARAAAIIAEREVGEVWGWAQRLIVGRDAPRAATHPRLTAPAPALGRTSVATPGSGRATARTLGQFPPARAATGAPAATDPARLRVPPRLGATSPPARAAAVRDETRDDVAATDAFRKTAPPSPSNAHPVRADQLPRIEWAAEGLVAGAALLESALAAGARLAHQPAQADLAPAQTEPARGAMPPLPQRASAAAPTATPSTVPLAPAPTAAAATVPLEPAVEPASSPRPGPRPTSPVRTVPVITNEAARAAVDVEGAGEEESATHDPTEAASAAPAAPAAPTIPTDEADDERTDAAAEDTPATWEPPNRVVVLPAAEGQAQRAARAAEWNDGVWPDDDGEQPQGAEERGLWSRIGQALARSTTRPLRGLRDDDNTSE